MPATPVKVLHVIDQLVPGGMERMAVELVNLIDPAQFECLLCATRSGEGALAGDVAPHVRRFCLDRQSRWDLGGILRFIGLVRRERVRVIHSHGITSMTFVALCRLVGRLQAVHVFHNHHGVLDPDQPAGRSERLAARMGLDAQISVSERLVEWGVRALGLPRDRVFLARNGVDLHRFQGFDRQAARDALGLSADEVAAVMVANLRPEKGQLRVLRATSKCAARDKLRLFFVGARQEAHQAYAEELEAETARLGLTAQTRYLGARGDVPMILAGSDIGLLASDYESGPLALLEYMSAGLPYVVHATGEIAAAVRDCEAGFQVTIGDVDGYASALNRLLEMTPEERTRRGELGKALVAREFDQRITARRVEEIYRTLLAAQGAQSGA